MRNDPLAKHRDGALAGLVDERERPSLGSLAPRGVQLDAASCASARRPSSSSPSAVRNRHAPASRWSCTAATPPPPAAASHVSLAWTISPALGTRATRANCTHST
jgi:hypothetical protein